MLQHSRIAPSSAGIWGKPNGCTGYVKMSEAYPELEESQDSKEGTASHEVAEAIIHDHMAGLIDDSIIGGTAENGVIITEEMYEGADLYAQDVIKEATERGAVIGPNFGVEHRIEAKGIHEESFGTVDAFLYDAGRWELIIWDYKFGYLEVDAYENWQGINYAAGLLDELGITGAHDDNVTVRIRIAQPRSFSDDGSIREWSIKASDLRPYFNTLANNAAKALSDQASTLTGPHCRYCEARHACPAALKAGVQLFEVAGAPTPVELSVDAMATQLSMIKRAKKQLEFLESGFEAQITSLIRSGTPVPGWEAKTGKGREKWTIPVEEVLEQGTMMGLDFLKPPEAITPAQARKLGLPEEVTQLYTVRPNTGLKIVEADASKAKRIFN